MTPNKKPEADYNSVSFWWLRKHPGIFQCLKAMITNINHEGSAKHGHLLEEDSGWTAVAQQSLPPFSTGELKHSSMELQRPQPRVYQRLGCPIAYPSKYLEKSQISGFL